MNERRLLQARCDVRANTYSFKEILIYNCMFVPLAEYKGNRINDGTKNDDDEFLHYYMPLKRNVTQAEYLDILVQKEAEQKEKRRQYDQTYKEKHADKIKERRAEQITCECGATFRRGSKARHEKTDKHKMYMFNQQNKASEVSKTQGAERIKCECGSIVRRDEKAEHEMSNRHQLYILKKT